jgi:DNA-binding transcriptional LysR family regulator
MLDLHVELSHRKNQRTLRAFRTTMDLRQLNTFRVAARGGSFAEAALELHYAPSTVTEQIRALEASVGTRLFERRGRGVALTDDGRRLLPYAEQMVGLADEARGALDGDHPVDGSVVIGGLETLCAFRLPRALRTLHQAHPDLNVRVLSATRGALEQALLDGSVDIALTLGAPFGAQQIAHRRLAPEPLALVVRSDHELAGRDEVDTAELAAHTFVITQVGCSFRALVDQAFADHREPPRIAMEFGSVAALKRCVAEGMGVTLLPAVAVAEELAAGTLVAVAWPPAASPPHILASWHAGRADTRTRQVALDHLSAALGLARATRLAADGRVIAA